MNSQGNLYLRSSDPENIICNILDCLHYTVAAEPTLVTFGRTFFECFPAARAPTALQNGPLPHFPTNILFLRTGPCRRPHLRIDFNMCHTIWPITTHQELLHNLFSFGWTKQIFRQDFSPYHPRLPDYAQVMIYSATKPVKYYEASVSMLRLE